MGLAYTAQPHQQHLSRDDPARDLQRRRTHTCGDYLGNYTEIVRAAIVVALVLTFSPAASSRPANDCGLRHGYLQARRSSPSSFSPPPATLSPYHWDFGDGASQTAPRLSTSHRAGAFTARVTGTSAGGETATAAVRVLSLALTLKARHGGRLRSASSFHRQARPSRAGTTNRSSHGRRQARAPGGAPERNGSFRIGVPVKRPATYEARFGGAVSNPIAVRSAARAPDRLSRFRRGRPVPCDSHYVFDQSRWGRFESRSGGADGSLPAASTPAAPESASVRAVRPNTESCSQRSRRRTTRRAVLLCGRSSSTRSSASAMPALAFLP